MNLYQETTAVSERHVKPEELRTLARQYASLPEPKAGIADVLTQAADEIELLRGVVRKLYEAGHAYGSYGIVPVLEEAKPYVVEHPRPRPTT